MTLTQLLVFSSLLIATVIDLQQGFVRDRYATIIGITGISSALATSVAEATVMPLLVTIMIGGIYYVVGFWLMRQKIWGPADTHLLTGIGLIFATDYHLLLLAWILAVWTVYSYVWDSYIQTEPIKAIPALFLGTLPLLL